MVNAILNALTWCMGYITRNGPRVIGWGFTLIIMTIFNPTEELLIEFISGIPEAYGFDIQPYIIWLEYAQAFVDIYFIFYLSAIYLEFLILLFIFRTLLKFTPFFGAG